MTDSQAIVQDWTYPPTPRRYGRIRRMLDPFLKREDGNAAFEVFQRRRKVHSGSMVGKGLYIVLTGLAALVILFVVIQFSICVLFIFLAIAAPFWKSFVERSRMFGTGKRGAGAVLNPEFWHEQMIADLWMSGIKGSEMLLAILLEKRSSRSFVVLIVLSFFWALMSVFVFFDPSVFHRVVLFVSWTFVIAETTVYFLRSSFEDITKVAKQYNINFAAIADGFGTIERKTREFFSGCGTIAIIVGVIAFGSFAVAFAGSFVPAPAWDWLLRQYFYFLAAIFIVFGIILHLRRRKGFVKSYRKLCQEIRFFDHIFDEFVRRRVIGDTVSIGAK